MAVMERNAAPCNILISSAGRRVALIREFQKALRRLRQNGSVVAIDIASTAPALYAADKGYIVPRLNAADYLDVFSEVVRKESITIIVPTIDPELPLYARIRDDFYRRTGARIMVSGAEVIDICSDKKRFFDFLTAHGIPTPATWLPSELEGRTPAFPLFAKPRSGFASVHIYKVNDSGDLKFLTEKYPDMIVQEHIEGTEYTVDLLSDLQGRVLTVVPRERIEVRGGEVTRSRTERNSMIMESSAAIAAALGSTGPITLQCIVRDGIPHFFEINPRVGGGLPASIAAGANTPLKIIEMCRGKKLRPTIGRFKDNHYMLRYDDAIYRSALMQGGVSVWRR